MERQAFLIIAHNEFPVLEKLVAALDCSQVDIYVHIDAKAPELPFLKTKHSRLVLLQKRLDVRWGHISQIDVELLLMEQALGHGPYSYYHIISGTHFPLQPVKSILEHYSTKGGFTVFSDYCRPSALQEDIKLHRYNFFVRGFNIGSERKKTFCQVLRRFFILVQKKLRISRNNNIEFYKANNWASFTQEAVEFLLSKRREIHRIFSYTFCGDEFFAPTLLHASLLFKDKIAKDNSILAQKMLDANAKVMTISDYDRIIASNCLFTRKVTSSDPVLLEKLETHLLAEYHESDNE